jgi:hypothetical protein
MTMNDLARKLKAASLERVAYKPTIRHVCYSRGQYAQFRTLNMTQFNHSTRYALCPHCRRMFYAEIGRAVTQRQFAIERKGA